MQKIFARADALIIRPVDAPPAAAGDEVEVLLLDELTVLRSCGALACPHG